MNIRSLKERLSTSLVGRCLTFLNRFWLDRVLLFAAATGFVLPLVFSGSGNFQFHGGVLGALGLGATFTVALVAAALVISLVCQFAGVSDAGKRKAIPLWIVLFFGVALGWLKLVTALLPSLLVVTGALAYSVAALVLLAAGMLTAGRGCRGNSCSVDSK